MRDEFVFSIDPPTAKDLDDAISCKFFLKKADDTEELLTGVDAIEQLSNADKERVVTEIGVHIADVSVV